MIFKIENCIFVLFITKLDLSEKGCNACSFGSFSLNWNNHSGEADKANNLKLYKQVIGLELRKTMSNSVMSKNLSGVPLKCSIFKIGYQTQFLCIGLFCNNETLRVS
jgi:hypothetical protein